MSKFTPFTWDHEGYQLWSTSKNDIVAFVEMAEGVWQVTISSDRIEPKVWFAESGYLCDALLLAERLVMQMIEELY